MNQLPSPGLRKLRQSGLARASWLGLLALVLVVAAGGWWWQHRSGAPDAASTAGSSGPGPGGPGAGGPGRRFSGAGQRQPVSAQTVKRQNIRVLVTAIGSISARNTAVVRTKVDGELKSIRFEEGQMVKAGQLLAEIDPRSYQIQLAQTQAQLAKDQSLLRNAQLDLTRYMDLLAKDSIASQQVDTQAALVAQLQATTQADQAQVDNARLLLSYTRVTAPISGRLGLRQADLGNVVRAADANGLVSITQTQPINAVFNVPEANLPQIIRKLKSPDAIVVEAWDREQRRKLAQGKVVTTDNAIDASTGTIKVKAEFANADGSLFPNQFVNVRMQVDVLEGVLTVPTTAVQRGAQGTFVYVIKDDGSVTVRRVRLGTTEGDVTSVEGELAEGDKVVTDGADRLREGAKVEVIAPAAAASAGRAGGSGRAGAGDGQRSGAASAAPMDAASGSARSKSTDAGGRKPRDAADNAQSSSATGAASAVASQAASDRPPWLDRLPPEVQERYMKMNPDERRAFVERLRERRRQATSGD